MYLYSILLTKQHCVCFYCMKWNSLVWRVSVFCFDTSFLANWIALRSTFHYNPWMELNARILCRGFLGIKVLLTFKKRHIKFDSFILFLHLNKLAIKSKRTCSAGNECIIIMICWISYSIFIRISNSMKKLVDIIE